MWFSTEARLPSLWVVLNPDSKSQLASHAKWGKLKSTFFKICFEKCNFLQATSNIGILYTIVKNFSSRVWIRYCYFKIRLRLARIHLQSFCLHKNTCQWFDHFHEKPGVLGWRGNWVEQDGAISTVKNGRSSPFYRREILTFHRRHTPAS